MTANIKIGGACGFWGDWNGAAAQLLQAGDLDYIVFDYLAEITMSILARARAKNPEMGYATDFINVIKDNLDRIQADQVKVLSNAGGMNPNACAAALRSIIDAAGADLKVAVVTGDDLVNRAKQFSDKTEMFSDEPFPNATSVISVNAYLGAGPIVRALQDGADIVVTGRCVDSALTLAACMHAFDWPADDWNRMAAGSLAGHMLECGAQATGGNLTDWRSVADTLDEIGYPIANISENGDFELTKPAETGGGVTADSVAEQMLYEIGDPQAYMLPDVVCDFSDVKIHQLDQDRVVVTGAKGRAPSLQYKTSVTYQDGWKVSTLWLFIGEEALEKANCFADAALRRAAVRLKALGLQPFSETLVEPFGAEAHYGAFAETTAGREVAVKIAAKHDNPKALGVLIKEATGLALSAPPGLCLYTGARPKPSPVVRLFSMLVDKADVDIRIQTNADSIDWMAPCHIEQNEEMQPPPTPEPVDSQAADLVEAPLRQIAWARSGDKGDKANIGVIPRDMRFAPWIWDSLTESIVQERFSHFLKGDVNRYYLPGTGAINFLLHDVLGGGGMASLRNDPQGKSYGQVLLDTPVRLPRQLLEGSIRGRV
ncbi:MAG: acyclic terpene utilization AtuA family protein [Pseudomonadota bacterium]